MSSSSTSTTIIAELATAFETQNTNSKNPTQQQQHNVTPLTIYQTGSILHKFHHQNHHHHHLYNNLASCFQDLIQSLSPSYVSNVICNEINLAFCTVLEREEKEEERMKQQEEREKKEAMEAIHGIYTSSALLCFLGFNESVCLSIVNYYNDLLLRKKRSLLILGENEEEEEMKECIFTALSALLLYGLIYPQSDRKKEEEEEDVGLSKVMEVIQTLTAGSDGSNFCLGDLQQWQQQQSYNNKHSKNMKITTLEKAVKEVFPNPSDQREYLLLMLNSCSNSSSAAATTVQATGTNTKKKNAQLTTTTKKKKQKDVVKQSAKSTFQNYISQIKAVLPNLGEGYIEVALSIYNHDVQRTLSSLIESESNPNALHPRLRALDPSLPARAKSSDELDIDAEEEAKRIQKAHLSKMESEAEQTSYMLEQTAISLNLLHEEENEYNDDYDDQYDAHEQDGGEIGNTDNGGMYDVDLDAVRAYNKATLEAEREASFWEENRNLNRMSGKKPKGGGEGKKKTNNNDDDENDNEDDNGEENKEEKKYRGPDKGKGGRIIGPDGKYLPIKKGGKKGKAQQQRQQQQQQQQQEGGVGGRGGGGGQNQGKKKGGQGGGGGRGGGAASATKSGGGGGGDGSGGNMTKIQKRRKNDNKSKIGNHHRKERALKKAGGGGPGGM